MPEAGLQAAVSVPAGLVVLDRELRDTLTATCSTFVRFRHALLARHKLLDAAAGLTSENPEEDTSSVSPAVPSDELNAVLDTLFRTARVARRTVDSLLTSRSVRTVETDRAGHYIFENIPSGKYSLWAMMRYGTTYNLWWQELDVRTGRDTVDLDNRAAAAGKKLYCGAAH
jgi:hypothetical protein